MEALKYIEFFLIQIGLPYIDSERIYGGENGYALDDDGAIELGGAKISGIDQIEVCFNNYRYTIRAYKDNARIFFIGGRIDEEEDAVYVIGPIMLADPTCFDTMKKIIKGIKPRNIKKKKYASYGEAIEAWTVDAYQKGLMI